MILSKAIVDSGMESLLNKNKKPPIHSFRALSGVLNERRGNGPSVGKTPQTSPEGG